MYFARLVCVTSARTLLRCISARSQRSSRRTRVSVLAALLLLGCDAFGPKLLSNDDRPFGSDAVPVPTPLPEEDRLICGDGLRSEDEECDDGNALSLDGCSQTCELEAGYDCGIPGRRCVSVCGDGIWTRQESCDDGNNVGEDEIGRAHV